VQIARSEVGRGLAHLCLAGVIGEAVRDRRLVVILARKDEAEDHDGDDNRDNDERDQAPAREAAGLDLSG
jgi:hypothetical protein